MSQESIFSSHFTQELAIKMVNKNKNKYENGKKMRTGTSLTMRNGFKLEMEIVSK